MVNITGVKGTQLILYSEFTLLIIYGVNWKYDMWSTILMDVPLKIGKLGIGIWGVFNAVTKS